MSAAPERIWIDWINRAEHKYAFVTDEPHESTEYVRSDLAPKPMAGDDLVELRAALEKIAAWERTRFGDEQDAARKCIKLIDKVRASRLSERRREWQRMPYDEAKAFLTWLDAQPTKPSEKLQEAYDFYLKNYKGDRPL